MSFKKIIHEVDKQGLDRSIAYTPKQLSEQGFMSPAISSQTEEKQLKNALVELTDKQMASLEEVVVNADSIPMSNNDQISKDIEAMKTYIENGTVSTEYLESVLGDQSVGVSPSRPPIFVTTKQEKKAVKKTAKKVVKAQKKAVKKASKDVKVEIKEIAETLDAT